MRWPNEVKIKEVGPRDGLQNEKVWIPTEEKIEWINQLSQSGIKEIEYSSFVHPKWIPQLSDAVEVGNNIQRNPDVTYSALVPNEKGLENALKAGIDMASVFMSASESHNKENINKSIDDTFPILENVISIAKKEGKRVTGYISTVFDCPFEGPVDIDNVLRVCDKLLEFGVDDLSLGDTIGTAVPSDVEQLLDEVTYRFPNQNIIMHFHDTYGMAIANIVTSMQYGINRFDASLGGLGGCPYAPGAAGNVATNDVLYLLNGLGIQTGIDIEKLQEATTYIQNSLNKKLPSRTFTSKESDQQMQKAIDEKALYEKERFEKAEAPKPNEWYPQRKREMLYFFIKNQYDRFRSR